MSNANTTAIFKKFNRICALLMTIMVICQFTPYWHFGENDAQSASISAYVWFPDDCKALDEDLKALDADHRVNNVVLVEVPILLLCAIGAVLCLTKSDSYLTMLFPVFAGAIGVIGYPCTTALRAGAWLPHMVICILMLAAGVIGLKRCRNAA